MIFSSSLCIHILILFRYIKACCFGSKNNFLSLPACARILSLIHSIPFYYHWLLKSSPCLFTLWAITYSDNYRILQQNATFMLIWNVIMYVILLGRMSFMIFICIFFWISRISLITILIFEDAQNCILYWSWYNNKTWSSKLNERKKKTWKILNGNFVSYNSHRRWYCVLPYFVYFPFTQSG